MVPRRRRPGAGATGLDILSDLLGLLDRRWEKLGFTLHRGLRPQYRYRGLLRTGHPPFAQRRPAGHAADRRQQPALLARQPAVPDPFYRRRANLAEARSHGRGGRGPRPMCDVRRHAGVQLRPARCGPDAQHRQRPHSFANQRLRASTSSSVAARN